MVNQREQKRISRMSSIKRWINDAKEQGKTIDKEKLIATICLEFGTSRRTSLEYINTLINSGSVALEEL
jgi:hypothetical protein